MLELPFRMSTCIVYCCCCCGRRRPSTRAKNQIVIWISGCQASYNVTPYILQFIQVCHMPSDGTLPNEISATHNPTLSQRSGDRLTGNSCIDKNIQCFYNRIPNGRDLCCACVHCTAPLFLQKKIGSKARYFQSQPKFRAIPNLWLSRLQPLLMRAATVGIWVFICSHLLPSMLFGGFIFARCLSNTTPTPYRPSQRIHTRNATSTPQPTSTWAQSHRGTKLNKIFGALP